MNTVAVTCLGVLGGGDFPPENFWVPFPKLLCTHKVVSLSIYPLSIASVDPSITKQSPTEISGQSTVLNRDLQHQ